MRRCESAQVRKCFKGKVRGCTSATGSAELALNAVSIALAHVRTLLLSTCAVRALAHVRT